MPQRSLGRLIYRLARSRRDWIKRLLIGFFHRAYRIDLDEAEIADPHAYASFNAYFTRALKAGARPIEGDDDVVVSPVDGRLTEFGTLDGDRLLQAKGMHYSLAELLDDDPERVAALTGGAFMTIYLAPHNYHRVHTPIAGTFDRTRYIAGRRFSVNEATARSIAKLFCINERAALWLSTRIGPSVVVMVGALNVASLTTVAHGEIQSGASRLLDDEPLALARGDELGRFNLGSTIVLLLPRDRVDWLDSLTAGQTVAMGQAIGRLRRPADK
ncbi:MAG: archaetidylserine decarboxylase [Gammaproteobacteria bacterium]|nr:archaetidylserine decarboxylase [Gammaproteobacteria bacterium]